MQRRSLKLLPVLILAPALSGCISLAAKPPASLLTIGATNVVEPGKVSDSGTSASITIQVPSVPASLATQRVPVQTSATSIAYVKDALWSEQPARLFARLMSDTIAAKTGRVVLTPAQSLFDPGARLSGELRNFGIVEASGEAVVTFDAALVRDGSKTYEKRRFEAREPVGTITPQSVGEAIDRAANRVAGDVATWVGR